MINKMEGNKILMDEIQEPFGKEELIGINGEDKTITPLIDLENTAFFDLYENYETPDGIIKPYETNSGRSDYNIAIKDNLAPLRVLKYGDGLPDKAIEIYQNNTDDFLVNRLNLDEINELNQQDIIYGLDNLDISIDYILDIVAFGDIKYFIESTFESAEYLKLIQDLELIRHIFCQESNVNSCCSSNLNFKNQMRNKIQSFYNTQNDVFRGMYTVENDQYSCGNFPQYTFSNIQSGFLRTTAENYSLENGNYPIYFRYTNPITGEEYDSTIINVSRNSGSD